MSDKKLNELKNHVIELKKVAITLSLQNNADPLSRLYDRAQIHAYEHVLAKIKELEK